MSKVMKVEMYLSLKGEDTEEVSEAVDRLKRLEHHIESFVDVDGWPEIQQIFGVSVMEAD